MAPTYRLSFGSEDTILQKITAEVADALQCDVNGVDAVGRGQNLNYRLTTTHQKYPQLLLRICTRKGYPALETLQACYVYLQQIGMKDISIVYATADDSYVPYGFFVQPWVVGKCGADVHKDPEHETKWLDDFLSVLQKVHSIHLPMFGYIGAGPQYPDIQTYFDHMDVVVDKSFGQVVSADFSIWALDDLGITSPSFLFATFDAVSEKARRIISPVQSVLVHGDMFPANLIYAEKGPVLIDWDEARANWWVYDLARTLFYYPNQKLFEYALTCYQDCTTSLEEIRTGIQLEHVRQYLRQMCLTVFGADDIDYTKRQVKQIEMKIAHTLKNMPYN